MQRKDIENKIYDILGHSYKVVFDASLLTCKDKEGKLPWSECNNYKKLIIFNPDTPEGWLEPCLIHEIIHAINSIMGLNLPHSTICSLEAAFYQIKEENNL